MSMGTAEPTLHLLFLSEIFDGCGRELTWKTLYNNVLDVNNADLALMIGDISEEYQNSSLFQRA
jgi:hypothetical protein